jgi:hypothetical protein
MDEGLSPETWRRLRQEARNAAPGQREVEEWTRAAMAAPELAFLAQLEQRLEKLNQAWAVHEKPLLSRIPLLGPLLTRLGSRLASFLLQNQVVYNAESARLLQELHKAQRALDQQQVERTDDLFSRLDERLLALEARLKDLEADIARLREQH